SSGAESSQKAAAELSQSGSYILRSLVEDVPLSADGQATDVRITCVELWNENLYIGTSGAEILHFVLIPPDPNDPLSQPTFIFASRLQPESTASSSAGIQQILLLPSVLKVCILCNGSLTFYTLPELSPAWAKNNPLPCTWIGGVDQNLELEEESPDEGVVIMMCLRNRIRLVRIGDDARKVRDIEFRGCLNVTRREDFACVADAHSYALLDVVHQQKIPLIAISSLDEEALASIGGGAQDLSPSTQTHTRSVSSTADPPGGRDRGHTRSTSLGIFASGMEALRGESPRPAASRYGFDTPSRFNRLRSPEPSRSPNRQRERSVSPAVRGTSPEKPLPAPPPPESSSQEIYSEMTITKRFIPLKPHIVSPTPTEFLLTTGTSPSDPGIGMFVNLDGEIVRAPLEFSRYPEAIVIDGEGIDPSTSNSPGMTPDEGYVLAVMQRQVDDATQSGVEIQRWDLESGEDSSKEWLNLDVLGPTKIDEESAKSAPVSLGIRTIISRSEVAVPEVGEKLAKKRINVRSKTELSAGQEGRRKVREKEEFDFTSRLCKLQTRIVLWANGKLFWVVRNPLVVRLDAKLNLAQSEKKSSIQPIRQQVQAVLNEIRGQESQNETDFFTLRYIRQKASILLFIDLVLRTSSNIIIFENEKRATEQALTEGEVDPRIVLSLVPTLNEEVVEGKDGIWVPGGLKDLLETFQSQNELTNITLDATGPFGDNILQLIRQFLLSWRGKKGFGSIEDEQEVFQTVDAALLRVLLMLDSGAVASPIRGELNNLMQDGVDCFDRAVQILEESKRLYLLSRLYHSRKMSAKVLETWRRMLEGEPDSEFKDGELTVRKYLSKIRDAALVEQYGAWLANRNPELGVQVFADDSSKVKFQPAQAVALLKENAPGAVKEYLEHLVFDKKLPQYTNDLITFYLTTVLDELSSPDSPAKSILSQTYSTYRALRPPKPTYRQFITDNALPAPWWQSRLRLLHLLSTPSTPYDLPSILSRIHPHADDLVPETIILAGRQGKHEESLRLLVHGLGDFDTAVQYCLHAGPPSSQTSPSQTQTSALFTHLLHLLLHLPDLTDRLDQTSSLLRRFGPCFNVEEVLALVPDTWSVNLLAGFLSGALARLVRERNESTLARRLGAGANLRVAGVLGER
ncbi:hypothetical protein M501DRAFT_914795, partial [Patellaria atrata CBS 101060]